MSIEFIDTAKSSELRDYIAYVESQPEWPQILAVRESAQRLIGMRGRLIGELSSDFADLTYDLNSYRRRGLTETEIASALRSLSNIESSYYAFAENLACWYAYDCGRSERREDFKDIAKELVAWQVWYRWKPDSVLYFNGLHGSVLSALRYIPHHTYKSSLRNIPLPYTFEANDDRGNKAFYHQGRDREMPQYRLRRATDKLTLEEIFSGLAQLPNNERLALLCVMGYIPGVSNMTQGLKKFGVDADSFRNAFERGLEKLSGNHQGSPVEAYEVVETAMNLGLVKNHNGKSACFYSPRLKLLELNDPQGLNEVNLKIYELARQLEKDYFRYSLEEIGELVGISTKTAVAKRIKRIADQLTSLQGN